MADDIGNEHSTARSAAIGEVVNSAIDYHHDQDVFRIEITYADTYRFDVQGATLRGAHLTLVGPDGQFLPGGGGASGFGIQANLVPGVYYLTVSGYGPDGNPTTGTYSLRSEQVNQAPWGGEDALTGEADTPISVSPAALLANDMDPNIMDTISFGGVVPRVNGHGGDYGSRGGRAEVVNGLVVFTPDPGFVGAAYFDYYVADNHGAVDLNRVHVTVTPATKPVATPDAATAAADGPVTLDVLANDKGAALVLAEASAPDGKGEVRVVDGKLVFEPGADFAHLAKGAVETVTLSYVVKNASGQDAVGTVTVTVTGVNDAPVAAADTGDVMENGPAILLNVLGNDKDVDDGAVLSLLSASGPAGKGAVSMADGKLRFDPGADFDHLAAGATETVTVSYTVRDQHGAEAPGTATITVTGTNDAPVATADKGAGTENQVLTLDVLANDTDVDRGAVLSLASASAPDGKGSVSVVNGKLVFDPGTAFDRLAAGTTETVTLTYAVQDQHGAKSTASVEVVVTGVNDAPIAKADTAAAVEDASVAGNVLSNDADVDAGAVLSVTGVAAGAAAGVVGQAVAGVYGTLTLNANGSYSYAADADVLDTLNGAAGLKDVFTYTVSDGQGGTHTATLEVSVALANDARTTQGTRRDDVIRGDAGGLVGAEDTIYGLGGNDQLFGGAGADQLFGGAGADRLYGEQGRDVLRGEDGSDVLDGGLGDDILIGGAGGDLLTGGSGADVFVFEGGRRDDDGSGDLITDFQLGVDHLRLEGGLSVAQVYQYDVDANGVLDAALRLSNGDWIGLLNVGRIDDPASLLG